ncbi:hypothetical protein ACFL08_02925 [Patescibacteria group bacterium]
MKKIGKMEILIGVVALLVLANIFKIITVMLWLLGAVLLVGILHIPFMYMVQEAEAKGVTFDAAFDDVCKRNRFRLPKVVLGLLPAFVYDFYYDCMGKIRTFVKLDK